MRAALLLLALALAGVFLSPPRTTAAHPLGNFTVNRYARVEIGTTGVDVRYILDMAEIPAFTELQTIDRNGDGVVSDDEAALYAARKATDLARGLSLEVDGARLPLMPVSQSLTFPEGQAGLKTLRFLVDYETALPEGGQAARQASFRDSNYSDRLGWKEVVVRPAPGMALADSSVSQDDLSLELTAYPQDRLTSPLDVREARFSFQPGGMAPAPARPKAAGPSTSAPQKSANGFARLVSRKEMTPAFIALSLLAAVAWGAAHALGPGHGKTIVAAYLVGERGTPRHAVILGLTVTLTHTSTVITLGLVTLYASRYIATQDLYLWLSVASGVLVVAMGGLLFLSRLRRALRGQVGLLTAPPVAAVVHSHEGEAPHRHPHPDEHHDHGHSHLPAQPGLRGLVALGISGGLLPCPTALVVMLAAIALDRVTYGLVLIFAFSAGLAGVLTGIGLLLVYTRRLAGRSARLSGLFGRVPIPARLVSLLPLGSAVIIFVAGLILTSNALAAR